MNEIDFYMKVQSGTLDEVLFTKFYDQAFFLSLKSLDKNSFLAITGNNTRHLYHDGNEWLYSYKDTYLYTKPRYVKIETDLYSFVMNEKLNPNY